MQRFLVLLVTYIYVTRNDKTYQDRYSFIFIPYIFLCFACLFSFCVLYLILSVSLGCPFFFIPSAFPRLFMENIQP